MHIIKKKWTVEEGFRLKKPFLCSHPLLPSYTCHYMNSILCILSEMFSLPSSISTYILHYYLYFAQIRLYHPSFSPSYCTFVCHCIYFTQMGWYHLDLISWIFFHRNTCASASFLFFFFFFSFCFFFWPLPQPMEVPRLGGGSEL